MNKFLIETDYCKKINRYLKEISDLALSPDEIRNEFFATLEILQNNAGGKILLLYLDESLQFFSRLMPILLSRIPSENVRFNQDRTTKIDYYIDVHLNEDIKEKGVAEFIGMSTGHFSRFFRKMYQCSFTKYLNRKRVDFAAKQLKDSDSPIIDICYQSGFSSHNQFNRVFKKEINKTPSEYREQWK